MILRRWLPSIITASVLMVGFVVLLERIEDRMAARLDNLDQEIKRVRQELIVDTQALDLEIQQEYQNCLAVPIPKKGE